MLDASHDQLSDEQLLEEMILYIIFITTLSVHAFNTATTGRNIYRNNVVLEK